MNAFVDEHAQSVFYGAPDGSGLLEPHQDFDVIAGPGAVQLEDQPHFSVGRVLAATLLNPSKGFCFTDCDVEILALVSQGGQGQVWCARVMQTNMVVAVKVANSPEERKHLNEEAGLISQFQHPNIVRALGWIKLQDNPNNRTAEVDALILEYCGDGDLWDEMAKHQKPGAHNKAARCMCDNQRFQLVVQLLCALVYINRLGFVHTDIKPHNLLVVRNAPSKYYSIKVADFGCAVSRTVRDAIDWGTFHYTAPEHFLATAARSKYPVDVNLDTWAVGVILVETLLGYTLVKTIRTGDRLQSFHESRSFFDRVLRKIVRDPAVNPNWVSVIHSMLQYNTKERPSPSDMLDALMADPAFEEHRHEMFADIDTPNEAEDSFLAHFAEQLHVFKPARTIFAAVESDAWTNPNPSGKACAADTSQAEKSQVQASAIDFDFLLARQRLYNDLDTDFQLDLKSLDTDNSEESAPASPQPWWALPATRATPQKILEEAGEDEHAVAAECEPPVTTVGERVVCDSAEPTANTAAAETAEYKNAGGVEGAQGNASQGGVGVLPVRKSKWGGMRALCRKFLFKGTCFMCPAVSE